MRNGERQGEIIPTSFILEFIIFFAVLVFHTCHKKNRYISMTHSKLAENIQPLTLDFACRARISHFMLLKLQLKTFGRLWRCCSKLKGIWSRELLNSVMAVLNDNVNLKIARRGNFLVFPPPRNR